MSGRNDDPRAGHPNGHPTSHPNVDHSEMPADLAAVQADDLLLDMLGSAGGAPGSGVSGVDEELARVLIAWRHDVRADSSRLLVDTDTALAVISAARRPIRRRSPIFGPIAAAAAVLVIAFSAVGLIAKSAQPGDGLWGVTEVLYSDYARSVETAASVRTELEQARTAMRQGKPEQARASLDRIQKQLPVIAEAEGRTDLTTQHRELEQKLDPDSPLQSRPDRPNTGSSRNPGAPLDSSSMDPSPSTRPDTATSSSQPTSSPSTEPTPSPSPSTEPTPAPSTGPSYPPAGDRPIPTPQPSPPANPDDQPSEPSARPIRSAPSDFMPPAPPNSPPAPPSGIPNHPEPGVSESPGDTDFGYGSRVEPNQPRLVSAVQLPPSSATTASA